MSEQPVLLCYHCGNTTPHEGRLELAPQLHYDTVVTDEGEEELVAPFQYFVVTCGTCGGLSVYGGFWPDLPQERRTPVQQCPRLYPQGPQIMPPAHTLDSADVIPARILAIYEKAWPLRHTNPSAFANQMRRALEVICDDQKATGATLAVKLAKLASTGVFPPDLADTASLVRDVGNRGSHGGDRDVDTYDAELIDELLKLILRYVYIGPSHRRRLRIRLAT
jgi:hypothetical protein